MAAVPRCDFIRWFWRLHAGPVIKGREYLRETGRTRTGDAPWRRISRERTGPEGFWGSGVDSVGQTLFACVDAGDHGRRKMGSPWRSSKFRSIQAVADERRRERCYHRAVQDWRRAPGGGAGLDVGLRCTLARTAQRPPAVPGCPVLPVVAELFAREWGSLQAGGRYRRVIVTE